MAVGCDYGTSILVCARKNEEGKTVSKSERNCFIAIDKDSAETLDLDSYNYIIDEEDKEEKVYIVGRDAIRLANLFTKNDMHGGRETSLRRPMAKMIINSSTDKKAVTLLKYMIQGIVGKPSYENEVCVISIPSDPISKEFNNIFHSAMCQSFIKELGYDVYPINEALAVVYATNPSTVGEEGDDLPMTGLGISFGGGGVNGCLAYKGTDTIKFSVPTSGDWIDEQVASMSGMTSSEITVYKEKASKSGGLNLAEEFSEKDGDVINGLKIYYKFLIETVVKQFKEEFIRNGTQFTDPIEVVVSGGTSKPNGFETLVAQVIKETGWPFEIKGVRRAKDPLTATAVGCLNAAISKEKKQ